MSDDAELDLLKRRRMLELRRRILLEKKRVAEKGEVDGEVEEGGVEEAVPEEVLKGVFVGRAWEVWKAAEAQYPKAAARLSTVLANLVKSGRLKGVINGEELYWFLRRLGLRVRLKTRIRIYEKGELKSVADKLRGR